MITAPQIEKLAEALKEKISFKLNPATRAEAHFLAEKPDWKSFERNLRSKEFRQAILKAEQSDPTLKKYVKNFGGYRASKDVIAQIKSKDSGQTYTIRDLHTGRWGCDCGDWQYHHSVKGGDCKHIKSVKQSKMVKNAGVNFGLGFSMASRADRQRRAGKKAKEMRTALRQVYGVAP